MKWESQSPTINTAWIWVLLATLHYAQLSADLSLVRNSLIFIKEYFDDYDRRAEAICEANQLDEEIVNFLYKPDTCTKSVSVKTCRHLWALIKDYDDDVLYGYVARKDCAKFKDFKEIVRTCVEDKRVMRFS